MSVRAAVLDFDGVIARSMENHAEAYRRVLAPLGVEVLPDDIYTREGARSENIIKDLLGRAGKDVDRQTLARLGDTKQETFAGLGAPPLYDGARAMVLKVREAAPALGIVTGTRRANLERLIPDLLPHFDVVLAQADYSMDKPHPEPYAKAAAALGADPGDCIALENALRGVQSAKAAGYGRVLAIATTMPAAALREAGADEVAADHAAAADALVAWFR